jgi:hypothetical protein
LRQPEVTGWFDRDKVEKILFNLISNAFKFTPPGGEIFVSVDEEERFFLESPSPKKYGIINCFRQWPGNFKRKPGAIFDRFYQVEGNSSQVWQGSGVGLSLTKNLVDIHYGNIHVKSEKWQGTTFTVAIPIEKENYDCNEIVDSLYAENNFMAPLNSLKTGKKTKKRQRKNHRDTKKPTVLIVEDNADVRLYIKDEIQNEYHHSGG